MQCRGRMRSVHQSNMRADLSLRLPDGRHLPRQREVDREARREGCLASGRWRCGTPGTSFPLRFHFVTEVVRASGRAYHASLQRCRRAYHRASPSPLQVFARTKSLPPLGWGRWSRRDRMRGHAEKRYAFRGSVSRPVRDTSRRGRLDANKKNGPLNGVQRTEAKRL